jgi:hypothetical protein
MRQSRDEITRNLAERVGWRLSNSVRPCSQARFQERRRYQPALRPREIVASRGNVPKAARSDEREGRRSNLRGYGMEGYQRYLGVDAQDFRR